MKSLVRLTPTGSVAYTVPVGNMAWAMGLVFDADGTQDDNSTFSLWRV
jgi:hypothetical protein